MNHNKTRSDKRKVFLKTGAIIGLISSVFSVFLITQTPTGSQARIGMILTTIAGSLIFLTFFLQLRQKDPDKPNAM
mgnify:CR=1 FL=1